MKIQAISALKGASNNYNTNVITKKSNNSYEQNSLPAYDSQVFKSYVNFTAKPKQKPQDYEEYQQFDNGAVNLQNRAAAIAKANGHAEITQYHIMDAAIQETLGFIDKLNKKEADMHSYDDDSAITYFVGVFGKQLFTDKDKLKSFTEILKDREAEIQKAYKDMPKSTRKSKNIKLSDSLCNDLESSREQTDRNENLVETLDFYNAAFTSDDIAIRGGNDKFRAKINDVLMIADPKKAKGLHFKRYDTKAQNVMKNLNMNTNVFVTFDQTKVNPAGFIPSLLEAFEKSDGKLNPKNTEIVLYNDNINMTSFTEKMQELAKNKDKNYIVIFSQFNLATNSLVTDEDLGIQRFAMTKDYIEVLSETPKNIHLVTIDAKDNYLGYLQQPLVASTFQDFAETSIPVLNQDDVIMAMEHNPKYVKKIAPNISKKALEKTINTSAQLDGIFPDKAENLLKKIALQHPDKKEITVVDVDNYIKDADYLFKQTNNDSSVKILFDTGKRLKDIIGKTNTKKEAEYIVKQIKSKKIGTKGFIIYSQDGMVGGGRRHTAEAIAGEAKVPFVAINTMDFATKDVDLFGGSSMSPEASIKKLFSLVTTQAESNPNKSAVLFIENFEYFSVGEMISEYHQKAMAQLIREMENAEKKGLNIVVMGSVSNPMYIGEATMKSFKFNDNIEVSSPAYNQEDRYEVLKHAFKENKIKIAGDSNKLLKDMSSTLRGFSFIELKAFAKKAESIAQERGHKAVDKSDMIESYMRITTGRPSFGEIRQHEKEITTKHECGHAVTLQVMNDLMKRKGQPWLIPDTVNFITLDPRGMYGGAMYHKSDVNKEMSFESGFSQIVCSYGGHSSEKHFYNMDGSYGITCDLTSATSLAEFMATAMGQGYYTGKISLANMYGEEDFSRNITASMKDKIDKDVSVITRNALTVSDMIVEHYSDFIQEFSDKYANLVGTGDCIIDGDQFRKELADWKAKQPIEKQAELDLLDDMILDAIKASKNGKIY